MNQREAIDPSLANLRLFWRMIQLDKKKPE